jgi:hypothetical protein
LTKLEVKPDTASGRNRLHSEYVSLPVNKIDLTLAETQDSGKTHFLDEVTNENVYTRMC